jgi:hypothetical protein
VPREVVRDRLDLTTQVARHRASVVAETLVERSLEPLTAVRVREQPVDPGAEVAGQRPDGPASRLMSAASHGRPMPVAQNGTPPDLTATRADGHGSRRRNQREAKAADLSQRA